MPGRALVQIQDITGSWRTVQTVIAQDQMVKKSIDGVAKQFQKLTRAVDENGNILQLTVP